jgi:hypothetical protein
MFQAGFDWLFDKSWEQPDEGNPQQDPKFNSVSKLAFFWK